MQGVLKRVEVMEASETTIPNGTASDQDERAVKQANGKGFLGSLRKKIAEGRGHSDSRVAESTGIGKLSCDSEAVGVNEAEKSSLPHKLRALVASMSSRGSRGLDTGPAFPSQPPASIDTGSPRSKLAALPPPTAVPTSPLPDVDHASAASVPSLPDAPHESAQTTASASSNELRPTFAAFLESVASAEGTRSRFESGCTGRLTCDGASVTDDAAGPSLPHTPSALAASLPSPKSKELDVRAPRHIPGPASVDAASLQSNLLVGLQAATVAYPSVDVDPVSPPPVASPTYTYPDHTQPASSPSNTYPSFTGPLGNSAPASNISTPHHEFDPGSLYDSPPASPASPASFLHSLLMSHYNEPDCVAAIGRIQEIEAAMASTEAGVPVPEGHRHRRLEDMEPAYIAAHKVLTDCEKRRQMVLKQRRMETKLKIINLRRDFFAMVQQTFGDDNNPAVVAQAWPQEMETSMGLTVSVDGDGVAG